MSAVYILFLCLLIITEFPLNCMLQYCPSQVSYNEDNIKILWCANKPNNYLSAPICLNSNFEFINRTCLVNGQWSTPQPPTCTKIQEKFEPKCGPNSILYQDVCIHITDPQSWAASCPVVNVHNITEAKYVEILYKHNLNEIWLPVKRSEPFGKFEWKQSGLLNIQYTHSLLKKNAGYDSPNNDCIYLTKINTKDYSFIPKITNCSAKYPVVCMYPILSQFAVKNNNNRYCSTRGSYTCYYALTQVQSMHDNNVCKENQLAEPLNREDNYLIKQIIGDNHCWFGLRRDDNGIFRWPVAQARINYSDWTISNGFQRIWEHVYITKNGWYLSTDGSLTCTVCQLFNFYTDNEADLTLQLNNNQTALVLTAYLYSQFLNIVCQVTGLDDIHLGFNFQNVQSNIGMSHVFQNEFRTTWLLRPVNPNYNYYQCIGEILPKGKIVKTKQILFGLDPPGREYAFELHIPHFCYGNKRCDPHFSNDFDDLARNIYNRERNLFRKVRAIRVEKIDELTRDLNILMHFRTKDSTMPVEIEFSLLRHFLTKLEDLEQVSVVSFKYCLGCLPSITESNNMLLHWNFTEIGTITASNELCLQSNLLPVTRECAGDFLSGATWLDVTGSCQNMIKPSKITLNLFELYLNNSISMNVFRSLSNLTRNDLIPADIYYISQILRNASVNEINSTQVAEEMSTTVSNIMATNTVYLDISNRALNSTNTILYTAERILEYLTHINFDEDGVLKIVKPNFMYYIFDPNIKEFSGIAVYRPNSKKPVSFNDYIIRPVVADSSILDLIDEDLELEVATYIPEETLDNIRGNFSSIKIHIAVFYNDSMFIEGNNERNQVASKVISIAIQDYDGYLLYPIPIIFKKTNTSIDVKPQCAYWDFGSTTGNTTYPSQWTTDGTFYMENEEDIQLCYASHLTHFALLLGYKRTTEVTVANIRSISQQIEFTEDAILDAITAIGCLLSTLGIIGIITTALLFQSWRHKIGSKILLHVSACSALQIFALYIADMNNFQRNSLVCILTGAILHYSILSGFGWSLVTAVLQYLRFVRVIGVPPPHLLLKTSIVGWVIPSVPVIIVLLVDSNIYLPDTMDVPRLCYPQGAGLYAGLFVPVIIVLLVNLVIFVLIIYNIVAMTKMPIKSTNNNKSMLAQQLKLAMLLFFLLGLTWLFGFLAAIKQITIFFYMFCATATLQGFVLFMFYVILDPATRILWINLFKTKMKMKPVATNKQAMSSTNVMKQVTVDTNTNDDLYDDIYDVIKNPTLPPVKNEQVHAGNYEEDVGSHTYDKIKSETHREGGLPVSRCSQ